VEAAGVPEAANRPAAGVAEVAAVAEVAPPPKSPPPAAAAGFGVLPNIPPPLPPVPLAAACPNSEVDGAAEVAVDVAAPKRDGDWELPPPKMPPPVEPEAAPPDVAPPNENEGVEVGAPPKRPPLVGALVLVGGADEEGVPKVKDGVDIATTWCEESGPPPECR
jgi:hypothetical protein